MIEICGQAALLPLRQLEPISLLGTIGLLVTESKMHPRCYNCDAELPQENARSLSACPECGASFESDNSIISGLVSHVLFPLWIAAGLLPSAMFIAYFFFGSTTGFVSAVLFWTIPLVGVVYLIFWSKYFRKTFQLTEKGIVGLTALMVFLNSGIVFGGCTFAILEALT